MFYLLSVEITFPIDDKEPVESKKIGGRELNRRKCGSLCPGRKPDTSDIDAPIFPAMD